MDFLGNNPKGFDGVLDADLTVNGNGEIKGDLNKRKTALNTKLVQICVLDMFQPALKISDTLIIENHMIYPPHREMKFTSYRTV